MCIWMKRRFQPLPFHMHKAKQSRHCLSQIPKIPSSPQRYARLFWKKNWVITLFRIFCVDPQSDLLTWKNQTFLHGHVGKSSRNRRCESNPKRKKLAIRKLNHTVSRVKCVRSEYLSDCCPLTFRQIRSYTKYFCCVERRIPSRIQ
jgi:hypothetical protein